MQFYVLSTLLEVLGEKGIIIRAGTRLGSAVSWKALGRDCTNNNGLILKIHIGVL